MHFLSMLFIRYPNLPTKNIRFYELLEVADKLNVVCQCTSEFLMNFNEKWPWCLDGFQMVNVYKITVCKHTHRHRVNM